jgi:ribosomal protein S18 acetylase RimI-like enzyme
MKVILEELRLEGAKVVLLKFHQKNEAARKLYESLGFEELGRSETHVISHRILKTDHA